MLLTRRFGAYAIKSGYSFLPGRLHTIGILPVAVPHTLHGGQFPVSRHGSLICCHTTCYGRPNEANAMSPFVKMRESSNGVTEA